MTLDRSKKARKARRDSIRADRARGFTFRGLARVHGVSLSTVHFVARDVPVQLPSAWHRARLPKDAPLSCLPAIDIW